MKTRGPHSRGSGGRPAGPAPRGAGAQDGRRSGPWDLARLVAASDDLEQALAALADKR